jgi:predicted acetylornithine/succinylornithine family transaminase
MAIQEAEVINKEKTFILQTYKRLPIVLVKGKAQYVWDINNKKYIDFSGGLAVCNLGYSPKEVIEALHSQAETLIHTSNLYYTIPQVELAERLISLTFKKGKVFFCNSGTEANEAAIKLAKNYKKQKKIISMMNSFHGRTLGALSITGQDIYKKGLEPLIEGIEFVKLNDIQAIERIIDSASCVIIELIQAEGGIYQADKTYIKKLRKLCDEHKVLLIIDEVQTGIGRCGSLFLYEKYEIIPDIITLGKGLGSGVPIGAMVVKEEFADFLTYPLHASTFGGNPLACQVAIATLDLLIKENIPKRVDELSKYFKSCLTRLKQVFPEIIKDIRGEGFLLGLELYDKNIAEFLVKEALNYGFILNRIKENIIRFIPPLIIEKKDIDDLIKYLNKFLKEKLKYSFK